MGDLRADLTTLLDRAAAQGSKTIAIAAIRRVLNPPWEAPTAHEITFDTTGWRLAHPTSCKTADCSVAAAARRQLAASPYTPGRYRVELTSSGALRFASLRQSALDGAP